MRNNRFSLGATILFVIDAGLLIACLAHIPTLLHRPRAPFEVTSEGDKLHVRSIRDYHATINLRIGDEVVTWNSAPVYSLEHIDLLADLLSIGDTTIISMRREGEVRTGRVVLVPFYNLLYVIVMYFIGLVAFLVGVYVLVQQPEDLTARVLHTAMVLLGTVVMLAWEGVTRNAAHSFLNGFLFFGSYLGVAASFFLLTAMFPRPKPGSFPVKFWLVSTPPFMLLVVLMIQLGAVIESPGQEQFAAYRRWDEVVRVFALAFIVGGILNFVHSYFTSRSVEERKKLKWVLWGLCLGPAPFLLFTLLPNLASGVRGVPEEYTQLFLVIIPISFGVSFVRYHLLNIEIVINRTTVYGIVLLAVIGMYVGLVTFFSAFITQQREGSILAAVVTALLFDPARRRVQRFVDKRFFRVQYDFRQAQRRIIHKIKSSVDVQGLAQLVVDEADALIPVERIGLFLTLKDGVKIHAIAHKNFDLPGKRAIQFQHHNIRTQLQLPVALDGKIESGVVHETGDMQMFSRWEIALVFPMLSQTSEVVGFLVLGSKKSGARFSSEDVDLLNNVALAAGLEIERFTLHHDLVLKSAEAERLAELNQLKSDFVSYVSHELRTPLTSIKMFTELLKTRGQTKRNKAQEYLTIIEGETDRLNRMVTTILDSAQIDRGVKSYVLKEADLCSISDDVMKAMNYQLTKNGFRITYRRPKRRLWVNADRDGVADAMINLIGNTIKYSGEKRSVTVSLGCSNGWTTWIIKDQGIGISTEALPHIFEKFYRDPANSSEAKGIGLGLPFVKHVLEAHNGTVVVQSAPGKGSAFTLSFPTPPKKK